MPQFTYQAKTALGKRCGGVLEAPDARSVAVELSQRGYFPICIVERRFRWSPRGARLGRGVGLKAVNGFTHQLRDLLASGVTLRRALDIVRRQTAAPRMRSVVEGIADRVARGEKLSSALSDYDKAFNSFYTGLVKSGEETGTLPQVLDRLCEHLERREDERRSVMNALAYPAFVFFVGVATISVLFVVVIPRMISLFDDFGQELPLSTRLVLGASAWLSSYGWVLCIGLVVAIGVIATARREERVAVALDRALLSIPAVGRVHRRRQVSEHSRTLGTLLGQGIAMLPALRVAQDTLTNRAMRKRMEAVLGDVANGTQLSMALRGVNLMSPLALDIVAVGEEAGTVHHALIRVSDVYDKELSALRKRMASLLEPAVVMVLAIGLGLIVMAIMMPIFQLDVMR